MSPGAWSPRALLREHAVLGVLFAVGAALRITTSLSYRPAMQLVQDSFSYLADADDPVPNVIRPNGYSFFLRLLQQTGRLAVVPAAQHAMGLSIALLVYVLLRRLGARPWLAALGAAPILLDATQIYLEQFIMSETFFETLLAGSVGLSSGRGAPVPRRPERPGSSSAPRR
ncbi:MAG: hypothetical protein M3O23_07645 [Actinomycetota bacterium]|nr:hypothetical protein [Actinomycetota bacterium]